MGTVLRCAAHVISGVVFFAEYAPEGTPVLLYSLLYNGSYLLPEAVLVGAILYLLRLRRVSLSQPSRALIIGAGADVPQNLPCIAPGTLVICADAGIEHAERWGITPHLVVGDLDSATGDVEGWCLENGIELMRFPVEKDKTDVELAIDVAVSRQVTQITLVGGCGGGRIDHSLANLDLLYGLASGRYPGES